MSVAIDKDFVTWDALADLVADLAVKVSGEYDVMLAITRGGLVPAGMLETGAGLRLAPRVSAELRGFVGACSPRVGVRFDGHSVAHYGQPFFGASLGVAVGIF